MAQGGMMRVGMGMLGQDGGSSALGGSGGQIAYPRYLLNGHPPADPSTIRARPGQRLRLRVINAAAETAFRVALGGHRLTVTHADGLPVAPTTAEALLLGMGERADALVRLQDGAFPLVALAEGKSGQALGWSVPARVRRRLPTPIRASWVGGWPPWPSSAPTGA